LPRVAQVERWPEKTMSKKSPYSVVKVANVEDLATGDAVEQFKFRKVGRRYGHAFIKRSDLLSIDRAVGILLDKNALLPADRSEREQLVMAAIDMQPLSLIVQARRMGWQNKRKGFLAATGPVGDCGNRELALPSWMNDRQAVMQARKGNRRAWVRQVAERCLHSSTATIVLCAAFAAPLLARRGMASFGINIYGISKAGKTAALLAGASVGGIGSESRLPNFRSSAAARGELCKGFNDQMLPLNEVGLLAGKKSAAYSLIRELIYQVSEGRDATRHSQSKYATAARLAEYHTIFVSNSEQSFDQYASDAREKRDAGEYARCLDIRASVDGTRTIMDRCPTKMSKEDRAAWARKQVIELRRACLAQHGIALPAYIEHLLGYREKLNLRIEKAEKAFLKGIEFQSLDGALQHMARNFGLLAAGGALAIEADLLPIKEGDLFELLQDTFKRSISTIALFQRPEEIVTQVIARHVNSSRIVTAGAKVDYSSDKVEGFVQRTEDGRRYTVKATAFRSWFGQRNDAVEAALRYLSDHKLLSPRNSKTGTAVLKGSDWAIRGSRWPDGQHRRSIVLVRPSKTMR